MANSEESVKPKGRGEQTGMVLEVDVIKKISHQLSRVSDARSRHRILTFVEGFLSHGNGAKADEGALVTEKQESFPFES